MQVEPKANAAVGRRALGRDLRSDILDIPIRGLFRVRCLQMKMIDFESHGNLLRIHSNFTLRQCAIANGFASLNQFLVPGLLIRQFR